jgi:hypothetical protein
MIPFLFSSFFFFGNTKSYVLEHKHIGKHNPFHLIVFDLTSEVVMLVLSAKLSDLCAFLMGLLGSTFGELIRALEVEVAFQSFFF